MHPIYNHLHSIVSDAHLNNVSSMTIKMMLKEHLQNYVLDAIYLSLEFFMILDFRQITQKNYISKLR